MPISPTPKRKRKRLVTSTPICNVSACAVGPSGVGGGEAAYAQETQVGFYNVEVFNSLGGWGVAAYHVQMTELAGSNIRMTPEDGKEGQ